MDQSIDIYAKAASELASIETQIAALEKRRTALRQFVELGQKLYAVQGEVHLRMPSVKLEMSGGPQYQFGTPSTTPRDQSLKARVLALAKKAIQERGPQSTAALVEYVEAAGVEVTGAHKPTTVSVILSRSADFESDRKAGWKLVDLFEEQNPQDAATSAGSSTA
jgi:hypothetical protein